MDCNILIKNLSFFAYHGVFDFEKTNGQNFIVDLDILTKNNAATTSDNIDDTVNYAVVVELIKKYMAQFKRNTIEKVAFEITSLLFDNFATISKIDITVKKPSAPIDENFDYMGVKLSRCRP